MRAVFDREMLVAALAGVSPVILARTPKPILQGVLLTVTADGATVEATDLEVFVRRRVVPGAVKVDSPGRAVLPMPRLLDALRRCDDAQASIEADEAKAVVKVGRSTFTMATHDPAEWVDAEWGRLEEAAFSVAAADLRKALARTEHCTDPTSTRFALGGVFLEFDGAALTAVATDGKRLACQQVPAEPAGADWPDPVPVVPPKATALVRKNTDDDDAEPVHVSADASAVLFRGASASVMTRRVEGLVPTWRRILPDSAATTARFPAASVLVGLVDRAAVMATRESTGIDLWFRAPGELSASARAVDLGMAEDAAECEVDGPDAELTVSAPYLAGIIRTLDPDAPMSFGSNGPKAPTLIRSDDGFKATVMPINME